MSSPVLELLAQERVCTDLFETISGSVDAASHASSEHESPDSFSDDVISNLLDQMVQILPPEERNIFGTADEKNIEEIIQEANELIRSTTPLFSSSDSYEKSLKTSLREETKMSIESSNKKTPKEETQNLIDSSNVLDRSKTAVKSKENSDISSPCSSAASIMLQDNDFPDSNTIKEHSSEKNADEPEKLIKTNKENDLTPTKEEITTEKLVVDYDEIPAAPSLRTLQGTPSKIEHSFETDANVYNKTNSERRDVEDFRNIQRKSGYTSISLSSPISSRVQDGNSKPDQTSHINCVEQMNVFKAAHMEQVQQLSNQIHHLNEKVYELKQNSKFEKSSVSENHELERLGNEVKTQEQLLIGYERENRKLCKEMSSLKEVWKHRESKLLEVQQRLQNELQGMVSKVTTEALEEQLKDARETIVKLQIELTTYKSKNKELEVTCEQLREERLRLQADLSQCRCDRTPGRRDKYSFLASSNIGTQINQLKAVIARKDIEIAQMSTTLGILKGEASGAAGNIPGMFNHQLETHSLTISQLQAALAEERQAAKDLVKEKDLLLKENFDLKRQVRELETIVKRRQRSESCFPVSASDAQSHSKLQELEKELRSRQEALSALHSQFVNMQKKYEDHISDLENRLKLCREELQSLKSSQKKDQSSTIKANMKKTKLINTNIKEETHLLATIRGLRQEAANREKEMTKLHKEIEEVRQTNKRLQKEREKQLNSIPTKMTTIREKAILRKMDKTNSNQESRANPTSPNNNINPIVLAELQEANILLKSKTKDLQGEVKRLEQDLIVMHNKRVHDLNALQNEHEAEVSRLMEERAAFLSQGSAAELQGQLYTQQMVINHLKNRLKQMEELKNEITLLRAERDHLEESLAAVNKKMCYLQNAQSPESIQYKTLLEKLETLEKNQEIREQKLNSVRELLSRSTQGQSQGLCGGTCRDKLLDKNRQICFYRAQMDRILESLLDIRRTK